MGCSNFAFVNSTLSKTKFAAGLAALAVSAFLIGSATPASAATAVAKGPKGQSISVNLPATVEDGTKVLVRGKNFSTKIGIYVTYCVIPPKGQRPDLCGPFDITGQNNASTWVSSNPPIYAKLLVKPFGKGGTFSVPITITRMIGDQDCSVVRCAVTTRADHINGSDRSADLFIPVVFKTATNSSTSPSSTTSR